MTYHDLNPLGRRHMRLMTSKDVRKRVYGNEYENDATNELHEAHDNIDYVND